MNEHETSFQVNKNSRLKIVQLEFPISKLSLEVTNGGVL